jgi:hypothetical protein
MRYNIESGPEILPNSKSLIQFPKVKSDNSLEIKPEPGHDDDVPREVGPPVEKSNARKIKNRVQSNSMCSNVSTKTVYYEEKRSGAKWVLVKNPDY